MGQVRNLVEWGSMISFSSRYEWLDAGKDFLGTPELDESQIVAALEVNPELGIHPEEGSQNEGGFGGYGPLTFDDLIHCGTGKSRAAREFALAKAVRFQKFLQQQATGSGIENGFLFAVHMMVWLVVIGDMNFGGASCFPAETETPLIVDPDAVLALAFSPERF